MEKIASSLGTLKDKVRQLALENSGHVVTRDMEKDLVFSATHQFIQDVLESRL
jgi:esterase/lipase